MSPAAIQQNAAEHTTWTLLLPRLLPSLFATDESASGEWWFKQRWRQREEQRCLCTLLQVSKGLQATVGTYFKGQLAISATPRSLKQAASFAKWLSGPGMASGLHMIKRLHLDFSMPKEEQMLQHDNIKDMLKHDSGEDMLQQDSDDDNALLIVEMQALAAQALQSAAARIVQTLAPATGASALVIASSSTATAARTLTAPTAATEGQPPSCEVDIRSLREPCSGLVGSLALLGCQITRLKLGFGGSSVWSHSGMQQLGEALQSLTGLKSLALLDYDDVTDEKEKYMGVDVLIPRLSGLDGLTSLAIQDYDTSLELPPQLRELTYFGFDVSDDAAYISTYDSQLACVALGSLTSLSQLTYHGGGEFDPMGEYCGLRRDVLHCQDVLAPNLLELHVPGCRDLGCVFACRRLRALHLESCQASDTELQQLSILTSLAEVNVEFCPDKRCPASGLELCYAAESSNAWVSIPLRCLAFEIDLAAAASGQSNDFSSLEVSNAQKLLSQLGHQTGLIKLELGVQLEPSEAPGIFMQLGLLADPLRQLSSLQELTVRVTKCRLPPEQKYQVLDWEGYSAGSSRGSLHHALSEVAATSANDKGSCQAVAQVIAALKDLKNLRLYGLPTDFVQSIEETLQDCGGRVALDVMDS